MVEVGGEGRECFHFESLAESSPVLFKRIHLCHLPSPANACMVWEKTVLDKSLYCVSLLLTKDISLSCFLCRMERLDGCSILIVNVDNHSFTCFDCYYLMFR